MPYYGHIYYSYGDFLANNLYVLLLIPVLLLSLWAQFQVSGSFRRYNAVNNRRRITGAQAAEAVLRAHGVFGVPVRPCRGNLTDHYDPRDNTIYLSATVYNAPWWGWCCTASLSSSSASCCFPSPRSSSW